MKCEAACSDNRNDDAEKADGAVEPFIGALLQAPGGPRRDEECDIGDCVQRLCGPGGAGSLAIDIDRAAQIAEPGVQ